MLGREMGKELAVDEGNNTVPFIGPGESREAEARVSSELMAGGRSSLETEARGRGNAPIAPGKRKRSS